MVKKSRIKFEIWKGKRVITVRDEKGKLLSIRPQKNSKIRTKQQAYNIFKKTSTLYKSKVRVSKTDFLKEDLKNIKTINLQGTDKSKTIKVESSNLNKVQQIGKNTAILKSKKVIKKSDYYQYVVRVLWGDKKIETVAYGNIRGTKEEGFNRAKSDAVSKGIINYDYDIQFINKNQGWAISPNRQKRVFFNATYEVQTYVSTVKNFN